MTNIFETIENNATYRQVLADSFGGVMYDVAKQGTYEGVDSLLKIWDGELSSSQRESAGGIMKGAIEFLKSGDTL